MVRGYKVNILDNYRKYRLYLEKHIFLIYGMIKIECDPAALI